MENQVSYFLDSLYNGDGWMFGGQNEVVKIWIKAEFDCFFHLFIHFWNRDLNPWNPGRHCDPFGWNIRYWLLLDFIRRCYSPPDDFLSRNVDPPQGQDE